MRKFSPIFITTLFILLFCSGYSFSEGLVSEEEKIGEVPIRIEADKLEFERDKSVYTTRGDVEVFHDNRILKADMIKVNQETKEMEAFGKIVLIDGEDILKADRIKINLDTQEGTIHNGTLFFKKENFHITSREIRKLGKDRYRIIDGSFTTCDKDSPPWKFAGKEVNFTIEGYATVMHALFYIKDIPVAYFPYLIYPIKRKRQTGFLIPSIGYSSEGGAEITVPFYLVMARNIDTTLSLDYKDKKGVGEKLEYRHVFSRNSRGNLYFYHMREKGSYRDWRERQKGEALISEPDRWIVKYRHEHYFVPSFTAKVDVTDVSDRDFYRDFDEIVDDSSKEKVESTVFLTKVWQRFNLTSEFRYTEDLEKEDKTTLQRLPRIAFTGSRQRMQRIPLFYSLTSTLDNFWREEGQMTGQRIDVHPKILYAFHTDYFNLEPELGVRETLYKLDHGEDRVQTREIYDFNFGFSTIFQRIFNFNGERLKKLKHSIRPELEYTFIPEVDQEDLPDFDSVDMITKAKCITYSLVNELIGKIHGQADNTHYHRFLRLKLSQSYDFAEAEEPSSDFSRPLSTILGELDIYPIKNVSLGMDGKYDTYDSRFSSFNALLGLKNDQGDFIDLEYRRTKDKLEDINTRLKVNLSTSFSLEIKNRHSIMNDTSPETFFGLEYKAQCWGIGVTYSHRSIEEEDRTEEKYVFKFSLTGVGEFGG